MFKTNCHDLILVIIPENPAMNIICDLLNKQCSYDNKLLWL